MSQITLSRSRLERLMVDKEAKHQNESPVEGAWLLNGRAQLRCPHLTDIAVCVIYLRCRKTGVIKVWAPHQ